MIVKLVWNSWKLQKFFLSLIFFGYQNSLISDRYLWKKISWIPYFTPKLKNKIFGKYSYSVSISSKNNIENHTFLKDICEKKFMDPLFYSKIQKIYFLVNILILIACYLKKILKIIYRNLFSKRLVKKRWSSF